jgi:hypothetical protein
MRRLAPFALLAVCLVPASARAQSKPVESPSGPPYAPIQLSEADLGTWDVELTGRTPMGARVTVRGIETNTVGCNGTCIVTRIEGELAKATQRHGGSTAWWRGYDSNHDLTLKQTGIPEVALAPPGSGRDPVGMASARPVAPRAAIPASRTSVEYQGTERRIVTVYRTDATGADVPVTRIVYTRRQ